MSAALVSDVMATDVIHFFYESKGLLLRKLAGLATSYGRMIARIQKPTFSRVAMGNYSKILL
jgi:hypothetical protein